MEPGYCLSLPILTMVVLQASQMEQVVFMSSLVDQGIIQAMKANYRKSMLQSLLAAVGKFNTATEFAKSVTVFDAIRWISSAWNNVREETIIRCSRRAGFASPETDLQEQEDSTSESDLVSALPEALQFEVASEDNILENEANIPVHENIASTAEGIFGRHNDGQSARSALRQRTGGGRRGSRSATAKPTPKP